MALDPFLILFHSICLHLPDSLFDCTTCFVVKDCRNYYMFSSNRPSLVVTDAGQHICMSQQMPYVGKVSSGFKHLHFCLF
jgi:hypothetical protein